MTGNCFDPKVLIKLNQFFKGIMVNTNLSMKCPLSDDEYYIIRNDTVSRVT